MRKGLFILLICLIIVASSAGRSIALEESCQPLIEAMIKTAATCLTSDSNSVCTVSPQIELTLTSGAKSTSNGTFPLDSVQMVTSHNTGGAVLVKVFDEVNQEKVALMLYGDAQLTIDHNKHFAFTSGSPACTATPSGLIVQTPSGKIGQVLINGATIQLASTAWLTAEGKVNSGSGIVFASNRNGKYQLFIADSSGAQPAHALFQNTSNADYFAAQVSHDGKQVAFTANFNGSPDIYVANLDGSHMVRLTTIGENYRASWSPDDKTIVFHSNRSSNYELYSINADGSNFRRLTTTSAENGNGVWSPDGSKIAFNTTRDGNARIYVIDADGSNPRAITASSYVAGTPAWSPDGSLIAFALFNNDKTSCLNYVHADGSDAAQPTSVLGPNCATDREPLWSPDGKSLVFRSNRNGAVGIYTVAIGNTNVQLVSLGGADNQFPSWVTSEKGSGSIFSITNMQGTVAVGVQDTPISLAPGRKLRLSVTNSALGLVNAPGETVASEIMVSPIANNLLMGNGKGWISAAQP